MRSVAPDQVDARSGRVLISPPFAILLWLAGVNALTFFRFWQDKQRAGRGEWRVSESELLSLAFLGGTPAAFAARHLLRHKTRKQPFSTQLTLIALAQAAGLTWLAAT
ncbi:DUF1294 domain-containing protein [Sphingomonas glaciei]|uniref:DUF1294 domain-containing protein n=1 Tax=Sphingomonas glaciei TaxID=2938948 RepID=UPI00387369FC